MKITLLQASFTSTDPMRNAARLLELARRAEERGASLCVAPELCVSGILPRDLLLNPHYIHECREALRWLASELVGGPAVLAGSPMFVSPGFDTQAPTESALPAVRNCAVLLSAGDLNAVASQKTICRVGRHDYNRYFTPGLGFGSFLLDDIHFGVVLGQDILGRSVQWCAPAAPDVARQADAEPEGKKTAAKDNFGSITDRPDVLLCLSAIPFFGGGEFLFTRSLAELAGELTVPLAVVNAAAVAGGTVFGGGSLCLSRTGSVLARGCRFAEDNLDLTLTLERGLPLAQGLPLDGGQIVMRPLEADSLGVKPQGREEALFSALCYGVKEFFAASNSEKAWLGLSGGLDSTLCAVLAAEALGAASVHGVLMPSPYTSPESISLAQELARNLGINSRIIPIEPLMNTFADSLAGDFADLPRGIAEENLQARIRGALLMALSNKLGGLVICPGNKSELAVGYSTLYGDSVGALAVLGDIYKTTVRELALWYNERAGKEIIPAGIIHRPPTAELSPGQLDEDALPPYPLLDAILYQYIEEGRTVEQIRCPGADAALIADVIAKVRRAEFKRGQVPPVLEVSARPFGRNWRMPLNVGK